LSTKWLEEFKIAIIKRDFERLEILLDEMPEIKDINQLRSAVSLINESKKLIAKEQKVLKENMEKIQKGKKFLNTYHEEATFSESI